MFRCTECNKEYNIKPDYCDDCGNDVFEEFENLKEEPKIQTNTDIKVEEHQDFTPVKEKIKPEDMLSYCIFVGCLFLSFIIIFFINPKFEEKTVVSQKEEKINTNIPPIDSFWNNELPKNAQISNKKEEIQEPLQKEPKIAIVPLKHEVPKQQEQKIAVPKSNAKQNTIQQVKPPVQNTKAQVQQVSKQQVQPKQQNAPKVQTQQVAKQPVNNKTSGQTNNNIQVPVWQQTQQIQSAQPVQSAQTTQTAKSPQQSVVQKTTTASSSQSLTNYKNSLRNKIGRAIDFADVVGDGSCALSFKVASNGKLIERKFVKQSTNSTLNDAVYKAIMQVPAFNAPPESYGGEAMQLNIKFYNGNFEISLN